MQVEAFKIKADEILAQQPLDEEKVDGEMMEDSTVAKLFEEVKIMFQDLPDRIYKNSDKSSSRKRFRFHPEMFHEFMYMSDKDENSYIVFFMVLSLFKEDMPWIYEMGKETYETLKLAKTNEIKEKAVLNFTRLIKHTHHPMFMEMNNSKDSYRMLEELMYFSEKFLSRMIHEK